MSAVLKGADASDEYMLQDLMRSGLVPDDFPIRPKPLLPTDDGHARYRLHYTADYYKDRIDRDENKYVGPKGVTPPTVVLGGDVRTRAETAFAREHRNAVVEGLKKSVLFSITTGIPVAVLDHCWGWGESTDGGEAKQIKNELLDGLSAGKLHIALFDGDWADNENVATALATYAMELDALGVKAVFPDLGKDASGDRQGYDDWFVNTYGKDRAKWPSQEEVRAALLALPEVPVQELEAAKKWALGSAERFNKSHVDFSDRGNATQFIRLIGANNMRYLVDAKKWVFWVGGRWVDMGELPLEMTNAVARHYHKRAERLSRIAFEMPEDEAHKDRRKKLLTTANDTRKWATGPCSSVPGRTSILKDIQSRMDFRASLEDFDADPDVLAVANGVVDLRTGVLREEVQEDRILKRCVPAYMETEPTGPSVDRIKKFLSEITGLDHGQPDPARLRWLQRRLGASLRGRNALDALEIWHGGGSNGKSVLYGVIEATLGEYAKTIPSGAIMASVKGRDPEAATPFLSMAIGRRIVFMAESKDTNYLNEQLVKQVTGGDRLNVREMYRSGGEHVVTFTPILLTNPLPQIAEGDTALWDRMAPFKFHVRWKRPARLTYEPDEANLPLGDLWFRDEAKNDPDALRWMLWWLVQGGVEWGRHGLGPVPQDLADGVRSYKESQNKLGRWMDDEGYVFDPEGREKSGEVYGSYARWVALEGGKPEKSDVFSGRLAEYSKHQVAPGKSNGVRVLKGIRKASNGKY